MEGAGPERRAHRRLELSAAVGIDTAARKDRVGVTRNLSATGILFHSASRFEVGERLKLRFRARPLRAGETEVSGRVVRAGAEGPRKVGPFPNVIAVEFDQPVVAVARAARWHA